MCPATAAALTAPAARCRLRRHTTTTTTRRQRRFAIHGRPRRIARVIPWCPAEISTALPVGGDAGRLAAGAAGVRVGVDRKQPRTLAGLLAIRPDPHSCDRAKRGRRQRAVVRRRDSQGFVVVVVSSSSSCAEGRQRAGAVDKRLPVEETLALLAAASAPAPGPLRGDVEIDRPAGDEDVADPRRCRTGCRR